MGSKFTRREFIRAGAAVAAFTIVPRYVLGGPGYTPPSEKIVRGIIGVGSMGRAHVGYVLGDRESALAAVCDVDANRLANARKAGRNCAGYHDFRELLARGDIEVAHIVTPPHWHALQGIAAAEAGCDVWGEKPMTRTIGETRALIDAVQRNGRMFRVNTWFRMYSRFYGLGTTIRPIKKLILAGELGWPLTARISREVGFTLKARWQGNPNLPVQPVPEHLDYDFWLGPAPVKPYHRHRTHGSFRGYWDYDSGGLGDMAQHYLDPVQYLMDKDHTSPVEIEASGRWPQHPDAVRPWGAVTMTYADGCKIIIQSDSDPDRFCRGKPFIEGPKGKIYRGFRTDPAGLRDKVRRLPDPPPQITDFNVSVRTRQKFGLDEVKGGRSNILVHLADVAIRIPRKLRFDPVKMLFIDDEAANRLVDQPMRAPWHL